MRFLSTFNFVQNIAAPIVENQKTGGDDMVTFIVVGKCKHVVLAVLKAIRSFIDAKCIVIGDDEIRLLRWSPLCQAQIFVNFDGSDDDNFVTAVTSLARRIPRVILIPVDCDAIRLINRVRDRISVKSTPIPDLPTLEMFHDKWRFHQFCTRHGLRVPETRFIGPKSNLDFDAIASELGVPFVVKPVNQTGSLGITIVASRAHLEQSVRDNDGYRYAPLIAQRYIDGKDMGLSLLSFHGRLSAFAIQQLNGSRIDFVPNSYLAQTAETLCSTSSYHGVMHVDVRIERSTGEIFLIESNPRFWTSLTAAAWCGLNFVAASIMPPAQASGVRQLVAGSSSIRHPVIRPSSWLPLLTDPSERGRLLRAETFDLYALGSFTRELPTMFWRYANMRALPPGYRAATGTRQAFGETVEQRI
jgi:predicted ATP-grasp superfamily ATP-dependent carboligase